MTFINQTYQRADAFLFGRRTYELFAPAAKQPAASSATSPATSTGSSSTRP
jgi:hypothetical protein